MKWIRTFFTSIALVILSIVLMLFITEISLRFTHYKFILPQYRTTVGYYQADPEIVRTVVPNFAPTLVLHPTYSYEVWSNELGCFDTPYLGEVPYIYLAGDSFTSSRAPFPETWGARLEENLGTRIVKCGVPGYGTKQELIKTTRDLGNLPSPELIILGYAANDIGDDRDLADVAETSCTASSPDRSFGHRLRCFLYNDNWFTDHSILYNAILLSLPNAWPASPPLTKADEERNFESLRAFAGLARAHGTKLLVVFLPYQGFVEDERGQVSSLYFGYAPQISADVAALLKTQGVAYYDLGPDFKKVYAANHVSLYWQYDPHLNIAGNQLAELLITKYIIENKIVPVKDSAAVLEQVTQQLAALSQPAPAAQ